MKVTVNKCPYTGKLFEDDKKYKAHLQKIRRERTAMRAEEKEKTEFAGWLAVEKEKIIHPNMIAPWMLENQDRLMVAANAFKLGTWSTDKFFPLTDKFTKIELMVKYTPRVSNTHCAPKGKVTNWHCKPDLPNGYPGWSGNVSGVLTREKKHMSAYPYSHILNLVGIHTGSGGGGNEHWGYGVSLFAEEWPAMAEAETFRLLKKS